MSSKKQINLFYLPVTFYATYWKKALKNHSLFRKTKWTFRFKLGWQHAISFYIFIVLLGDEHHPLKKQSELTVAVPIHMTELPFLKKKSLGVD